MDDKKLDVIDSYIDRQQKYINDLLQEKMLLEAKNSYLNQRVEELEKINKENEDKLNILNKRFTEKNEQTMNIKSVFGNLFGGKLDNESEVNNMTAAVVVLTVFTFFLLLGAAALIYWLNKKIVMHNK